MYEYYLTFRSMTSAQSAVFSLYHHGITASLTRIPKQLSKAGCGYGIKLIGADAYAAASILRQEGRPYERVFRLRNGQIPEEVYL